MESIDKLCGLVEQSRHVKPDLVKELLEEFASSGTIMGSGAVLFEVALIDEYAEKIREAVSAE